MRRRTITLVVVGLVMALFVLPAAAQAVLDSEPEPEEAVEDAMYELEFFYDKDSHIVHFGFVGEPEPGEELLDCSVPEGVVVEVDEDTGEVTYVVDEGEDPFLPPEGCEAVNIEGPNGQVNHGQFVSNMVHALKAEYDKDTYGPFGQWVKQFAHDEEIGKGDTKVKAGDDDLEPLELEAADADDDDEPGHGKDKNKDKGKGQGKNK